MVVVWMLVGAFIGVIVGMIATWIISHKPLVGDLIIAHPDNGEPPSMLAQYYDTIDTFQNEKRVLMNVVNVKYNSQE